MVRAESEELLSLAEAAKNDTASDPESHLENSNPAIRGPADPIGNIEPKHAEVQFLLNTYADGKICHIINFVPPLPLSISISVFLPLSLPLSYASIFAFSLRSSVLLHPSPPPLSSVCFFLWIWCFWLSAVLGNSEKALTAQNLAIESQKKADDAVEAVQPILNTLDSDLYSINSIPQLQDKIDNVLLTQIDEMSMYQCYVMLG